MQERKIIQKSKSFKDLDRTLKKLIKKKKSKLAGSIFEYLVKLYFEVSPEYKSKLSKVYLLNEVPSKVKKKLKLPNRDEGIDLIAVTFDNQYWAVQCKYRSDNSETIKVKGDLATFNNLAFTVCKNISHGIVCSTVNRPPKKTKLLRVGYVLLTEWLKLDKDNGELYNQIKAKAVGKIIKPKKLYPRAHQKKAIKKSIYYFKRNERGKMIMPCGTGKSLTAFWIAKKMKPKSILIAVPSLALLQQTLKVWTREFLLNNIEPDWLCVCSDDTVKEEQDDFVSFSADLGIKVDTDPRVIRNFLRKKTKKLKIVFTTYQSGRATAIGSKKFIYDFGIMDEAHKTVGSSKKQMAHLLHQKNIKIKKRLFMTATERLFKGDSDEYMSMDDPRDYGNIIYELSFKEAINAKPPIISDYKIITFGITTPEIEKITEDNKYLDVKNELKDITARELATAIALRKAIKKLKIKNAISFHRSIKRAENFRKQQDLISKIYPTYGNLKTFHVKGNMPTSDRALEMLSFEEEKGLMTNARCLTEGVDLPAIDCVCFTDPKRSKVDIVQAAGRTLRLSKGKKFGYILIPIFIPDGLDFNQAAAEQGFDDVSITVRALATTDKRIVEYLRGISEGKRPKGGSPVDGVTSINSLYKVEAEEFDNAVKLKVWNKVSIVNYRSYDEAKKFVKKLNLSSASEWDNYCHNKFKNKPPKPLDIPINVGGHYRKLGVWNGFGDFLGHGRLSDNERAKLFWSFEKAKKYLHKQKFFSYKDYEEFVKNGNLPEGIPSSLITYKKDNRWRGHREFVGTIKRFKSPYVKFLKYDSAKKFVNKLNLRTSADWVKFTKNELKVKFPVNLPYAPGLYYKKKGWKNWKDWLGPKYNPNWRNEELKASFLSFSKAKKYIQKLKLKNISEWKIFAKSDRRPSNIPVTPYHYSNQKEWKGLQDFLGTKVVYFDINKSRKIINRLKLRSKAEYYKFKIKDKKLYNIPTYPDIYYKKEWKGWKDWIGPSYNPNWQNDSRSNDFVSFKYAKKIIKKFNIKSMSEWKKFKKTSKVPKIIPKNPYFYKKDKNWKGIEDYFGYK